LTEAAPVSATAAAMAAAASSSLIWRGRKSSITATSAASASASSSRPPLRYISIDSRRCLIIFCSTSVTIASSSSGALDPRSSMSRFFSADWTRRSAPVRGRSPAFMALVSAALMSSRIIGPAATSGGKREHSRGHRRLTD
jgi:hypothetical protein